MNKTLIAFAPALAMALAVSGCNRNAADQPENATANAPSTATPSETAAATTPPTANDSADATTSTTGTNPQTTGVAGNDPTDMGSDTGMGGTTTAGTASNLEEELRRCDQLSGAERDTCRSEAQTRSEQQAPATPTTP